MRLLDLVVIHNIIPRAIYIGIKSRALENYECPLMTAELSRIACSGK